MIVSKTPFRISFAGGGSDLPAFYKYRMGAVVSTSINKYMYVALNKRFEGGYRINYSLTETSDKISEINHPLVRECLRYLNISLPLDISSLADIPSGGTGLGSSSSYTVGLLKALLRLDKTNYEIASIACQIEIDKCKEPIGKQDQFSASLGGLNLLKFNVDNSVDVEKILISSKFKKLLENSFLIFHTNSSRNASKLLKIQSDYMTDESKRKILEEMVELAFETKICLENEDFNKFGEILDHNWILKKQITDKISNPEIDRYYSIAKRNGALGGKLLGAGEGGFLAIFAEQKNHNKIKSSLNNLTAIDIKFSEAGSTSFRI